MKKFLVALCCLVLVLAATGCSSKSNEEAIEESFNAVQDLAEQGEEAAETTEVAETSETEAAPERGALKEEYKDILDKVYAAKERGYAYGGMMDFTVKGDRIKRAMTFGNDGSYTVGEKGGKAFEVTLDDGEVTEKVEADPEDLFGEYAAGDMLQFYVERLEDNFYAASGDMKFDEGRGSIIVLTDVSIESGTAPSGAAATIITVHSYPETMPDDKGYEVFIVAEDGLLEEYTLSTPILNSGKPAVTTFEFISRGPIDDAEFSDLD